MYPEINFLSTDIKIYSFGLLLSISIALFIWMIRKTSKALEIRSNFFFAHILWYFAAIFVGSRLFHVLFYWGIPGKSSFSFEHPILSFFTMWDFYFSLAGAIVWFVGILYWKTKDLEKEEKMKIYDIVALSFLFACCFGYIGSFLGGQTYGVLSRSPISIDYSLTNPNLWEFPRFPLGLIYTVSCAVIFSLCYIFRKARSEHGISAFIWILLFSVLIFVGEFWNPATIDSISQLFGTLSRWRFLNINQVIALGWVYWSFRHLIIQLDLPVGALGHLIFQTKPKKKKKTKKKTKKKPKKKK